MYQLIIRVCALQTPLANHLFLAGTIYIRLCGLYPLSLRVHLPFRGGITAGIDHTPLACLQIPLSPRIPQSVIADGKDC
jgi:hypothetical protein